jgi:HSP20 family molecular chaperone IbpA
MKTNGEWQAEDAREADDQAQRLPENLYAPALDIHETPEGLVLEADLPGVAQDQLRVQVKDNVLEIYGKVSWPIPEGARLLHEEVRQGDFARRFILSDEVDTDKIVADFNQGVLRLHLPRAAKTKPRKIEVRSTSSKNPQG